MLCEHCIPPSTTDSCGRDSRGQVPPTPHSRVVAVNHVPGLPHQSTVLTPFLLNGDACTGSSSNNTVCSCKTIL